MILAQKKNKVIFISACEISGDRYASHLVKALKEIDESLQFVGIGGKYSQEAGVELLYDVCAYSTVGILEPFRYLPRFISILRAVKRFLKRQTPDLFIAVDGQGLNMLFLKAAKSLDIATSYFITPQEWQWGTERGGRKVVAVVDEFLCIFPEAAEFYNRLGGSAQFVGHPLIDMVHSEMDALDFRETYDIAKSSRIVGVFPGSRLQEIRAQGDIFIASAKRLEEDYEGLHFCISVVYESTRSNLQGLCEKHGLKNYSFYTGVSYDLIANACVSLVSSGTITLEHALLETPFVAAYRFHPWSYKVVNLVAGKKFRERIGHISLPNLILKDRVFPEFFQDGVTVEALSSSASLYLSSDAYRHEMQGKMVALRNHLGAKGIFPKLAQTVYKLV